MLTLIPGNRFGFVWIFLLALSLSVLIGTWNTKNNANLKRWNKECKTYKENLELNNEKVISEFLLPAVGEEI